MLCPGVGTGGSFTRKGRFWKCTACLRGGLKQRQRHRPRVSRSKHRAIKIPLYGEQGSDRYRVVAYAFVSPIDSHLTRYKWRVNNWGYAYRQSRRGYPGKKNPGACVRWYMHRVIMGLNPGNPLHVHHMDDDPINNRRSNLEVLTASENQAWKYR